MTWKASGARGVTVPRCTYATTMTTTAVSDAIQEGRDELTPEESRRFAEEQVGEYFGISVEEFRRRAEAGSLPEDDPMVVHLALLTGADLHTC